MPKHDEDLCPKCAKAQPFDAEVAYRRLAQKHMQLAALVSRYMSEAGLERGLRASNAANFAAELERIVGGTPAAADEFPECCLVGRSNPNGTVGWFCSGALIHSQVVVSAGHCLVRNNVANVVALKAANQNLLGEADIVPVKRIVAHPLYIQTHQYHDISVLILQRPSTVQPVGIANTTDINASRSTTLVGFGNDDVKSTRGFGVKRKVTVDITGIRRSPSDDLNSQEHSLGFDANVEFVAGGGGYDSCNGDSGGPAYIDVGTNRALAGVTSRAIETAVDPCGEGGIYSRLDVNMDFVRQTASAAGITL
jgi:secreted trypsin-like serine protease